MEHIVDLSNSLPRTQQRTYSQAWMLFVLALSWLSAFAHAATSAADPFTAPSAGTSAPAAASPAVVMLDEAAMVALIQMPPLPQLCEPRRPLDGTMLFPFQEDERNGTAATSQGQPSAEPVVAAPSARQGAADSVQVEATSASLVQVRSLFDNNNVDLVRNAPTQPTTLTVTGPTQVTYLMTYHWNDGRGQTPGTVGLRHTDGTAYGPWPMQPRVEGDKTVIMYWECRPNVVIKAGTYTVVDSDPSTWSHNARSGNAGICTLRGIPLDKATHSYLEGATVWSEQDGGNGHGYRVVAIPAGIDWDTARIAAEQAGGYLATITSAEENKFIYGLIEPEKRLWFRDRFNNGMGPWLGATLRPDRTWAWVSGEPWGYTNWRPGQPDNAGGGEDRINFFALNALQSPAWNDVAHARNLKSYIIEFDASRVGGQSVAAPTPLLADTSRSRIRILFDNNNIYLVRNEPTQPTTLTVSGPTQVTDLMTYHWNDGLGQTPGTVMLRHADGTTYGPWPAQSRMEGGRTKIVYWECRPNIVIKAGTYTVIDSDPSTWSQNTQSGHAGICTLRGIPLAEPTHAHLTGAIVWSEQDGGNGHSYRVVAAPAGIDWDTARIAAEQAGGYLVTVTSAEENQFIYGLIEPEKTLWFKDNFNNGLGPWLGATLQSDRTWRWVNGEPWNYTNWHPGQPDNAGGGEDRINFFALGALQSPAWNDFAHARKLKGYIIEFDAPQTRQDGR